MYTADAAVALEMITESGQTVTVRRYVAGTYNPVTDTDTGAAWSTFTVPAVRLPLMTGSSARDQIMVEGATSLGTSALFLMPGTSSGAVPLPFSPQPGDRIVEGVGTTPNSKWWSVDSVSELAPDGDAILYTIIAKKGDKPS